MAVCLFQHYHTQSNRQDRKTRNGSYITGAVRPNGNGERVENSQTGSIMRCQQISRSIDTQDAAVTLDGQIVHVGFEILHSIGQIVLHEHND